MGFVWDRAKAEANQHKHGVDFADAIGALEDPLALTQPDPFPSERRFVTVGRDLLDRIAVVIWTHDQADIRLISARLASPRERRDYTEDSHA